MNKSKATKAEQQTRLPGADVPACCGQSANPVFVSFVVSLLFDEDCGLNRAGAASSSWTFPAEGTIEKDFSHRNFSHEDTQNMEKNIEFSFNPWASFPFLKRIPENLCVLCVSEVNISNQKRTSSPQFADKNDFTRRCPSRRFYGQIPVNRRGAAVYDGATIRESVRGLIFSSAVDVIKSRILSSRLSTETVSCPCDPFAAGKSGLSVCC